MNYSSAFHIQTCQEVRFRKPELEGSAKILHFIIIYTLSGWKLVDLRQPFEDHDHQPWVTLVVSLHIAAPSPPAPSLPWDLQESNESLGLSQQKALAHIDTQKLGRQAQGSFWTLKRPLNPIHIPLIHTYLLLETNLLKKISPFQSDCT